MNNNKHRPTFYDYSDQLPPRKKIIGESWSESSLKVASDLTVQGNKVNRCKLASELYLNVIYCSILCII